jgi:putative SOS response-associated peptidase YedK
MCGRFLLSLEPADLQDAFPQFKFPEKMESRFNIAPTQPVLAIPNTPALKADFFLWGLIPSWAKDPSIGPRLINARAETLSEKPSFRGAYKNHRCLILSNGFYEWQKKPDGKTKTPFHIRLKNEKPFGFAGLFGEWASSDGTLIRSCTIITTTPNELIVPIHDRMPVILPAADFGLWLDPSPKNPGDLQHLLIPYPAEELIATEVSTYVNNPANIGPACIAL